MDARIRDYQPSDGEAVVGLSLRAWVPVFASMERVLGHEIVVRLHGEDWREYQARSVREVLADDANADPDGQVLQGAVTRRAP